MKLLSSLLFIITLGFAADKILGTDGQPLTGIYCEPPLKCWQAANGVQHVALDTNNTVEPIVDVQSVYTDYGVYKNITYSCPPNTVAIQRWISDEEAPNGPICIKE